MDVTSLLAQHVQGNRRRSTLTDDETGMSVAAKVFSDDEHTLLQIRAWLPDLADGAGRWFHAHFDAKTAALLVSTTGTQDQDAHERAVHELVRRGIYLN